MLEALLETEAELSAGENRIYRPPSVENYILGACIRIFVTLAIT